MASLYRTEDGISVAATDDANSARKRKRALSNDTPVYDKDIHPMSISSSSLTEMDESPTDHTGHVKRMRTDYQTSSSASSSPVKPVTRASATWNVNSMALRAERVLTSRRGDDELIRSILLSVRDENGRDMVIKFFGATRDPSEEEEEEIDGTIESVFSFMKREIRVAELMSMLVTMRIAPGLMLTHGTTAQAHSLGLPILSDDTHWRQVDNVLRGSESLTPQIDTKKEIYMGAIISEFIEGGLAVHVLPTMAGATQSIGAELVTSLYGQLQWTLASIHSVGFVHADVQVENLVVRHVPSEPETRFILPGSDHLEYRFLSGSSATMPLLKLIDYGITDANNTPLNYCPTSRFARAPEFFVAFNPERPDRRLTSSVFTHLRPSADTWSGAMSFFTILCGGLVPGHGTRLRNCHDVRYHTTGQGTRTSPFPRQFRSPVSNADALKQWKPPRGFVAAVTSQISAWKRLPHGRRCTVEMERLCQERVEVLAAEIWRLAMLFGIPTAKQWPDTVHMPFIQLLRNYNVKHVLHDTPDDITVLAPHAHAILYAALDQYAPTMPMEKRRALETLMARQLQWNPSRRLRPREVLVDPAMRLLCGGVVPPEHSNTVHGQGDTWVLHLNTLTGRLTDPATDHPAIVAAEKLHVDISYNRL